VQKPLNPKTISILAALVTTIRSIGI